MKYILFYLKKSISIKGFNQSFKSQLKVHNKKHFLKLIQKYQNKAEKSCHLQVR